MPDPLRVGVLGLTHDHVWHNLGDLNASPLGKLVAVADPHPALLEQARRDFSVPLTFESYTEMLDTVELDAVYVYSDNATGAELGALASTRGLHVMIEKPMAATLAGADRLLAAAREAGVTLMVSWPFAWRASFRKALDMARAGEIGDIIEVKYRAAHAGPKEYGCTPYFYNWLYDPALNGAGALMDYCCYGAALARCLLGQPSRVVGVSGRLHKDYIMSEDNAVLVMGWARAMALSEASWTQIGKLTAGVTVIYGTEGTLVVESGADDVLLATRERPDEVRVPAPPLPDAMLNATAHFLSRIAGGLPIDGLCSAEVGRDVQEILEAGLISASTGAAVSLPLPIPFERGK